MADEQIELCPFCACGDWEMQPVVTETKEGQAVICTACSALGPATRTREQAIAAWNARTPDAGEVLREASEEIRPLISRLEAWEAGIAERHPSWSIPGSKRLEVRCGDLRRLRAATPLITCALALFNTLKERGGQYAAVKVDGPLNWVITEPRTQEALLSALETDAAALSSLPPLRASQDGWQPWQTAPINEVVDWWIDSDDEGGWLKRGYRRNSADPLAIVEEDGGLYWPHENGGWPTHWQPLPEPPASLRASQEKQG